MKAAQLVKLRPSNIRIGAALDPTSGNSRNKADIGPLALSPQSGTFPVAAIHLSTSF